MHINRILFYWSQYLGADPKEITLISRLLVTVSVVGFFQIVSLRATSTATPSYDEQYHEFVERSQAFEQSYEKIIGSMSDSLLSRSYTTRSDSGDTLTINMNSATHKEWVQLPGIGEVYA
jgi:DNA uptake protein ComE-like DNA-binding protein